jgi:hypothetical protein
MRPLDALRIPKRSDQLDRLELKAFKVRPEPLAQLAKRDRPELKVQLVHRVSRV